MNRSQIRRFLKLTKLFSKPHPWHGIDIGEEKPDVVKVFIEIVPGDTMKYELDKESGYLKVDRPQRFSNICPLPYGFIPQTLCAEQVGNYCAEKTGRPTVKGDQDPLDICVITERNIPHGNLILDAIPVGGFRMLDGEEADDKIIAVMKGDASFGGMSDIKDVPKHIVERLSHYFLTYKERPFSDKEREVEITHIYGQKEAKEVISRSINDYNSHFDTDKKELFELIGSGLE
ncbi:inorganic pyrophosphatase [Fodinibius halophilus]|uniref:inorganic diphosphatase n=1 Tax=Fodinibius halophilus TaxID=1736908 RepID=A0A6M1T7Q2_9BACT|nr:inorganic pyrophosphatase [Fodinibius halophilus]NGP88011.1 inorganic pyrophosphatase [Fodinibius halophilus]